ncbi:MAG: hypothetical protein AAF559_13095 [Pseudomonadota bacterium]
MFFVKALGGCLLAVFGGLFFMGFFDHEQAVLNAVETVREAEIEDNKNARWGPQCDGLRDKVMGVKDGVPVGLASGNPIKSIAKLHAAERRLKEAGCDIDAAPGAINPFDKSRDGGFREVTTTLSNDPADNTADGSEWGGDPNAFNEGGSDDWGVNE